MKKSVPARRADLAADLMGIWELTSRVDVDSAGARHIDPVLGADPLGIVCFAGARFAAQYMKRDRAKDGQESGLVSRENVSSVLNGYDGHFGAYEVDVSTKTLKVRLEGAISPADIGREFERRVDVRGNELRISLDARTADGTQVTRTLTFARLAACQPVA